MNKKELKEWIESIQINRIGTTAFLAQLLSHIDQLDEPDMLEALMELVHLHLCEQEGLQQPTPAQWMAAVDKASIAINKALNETI